MVILNLTETFQSVLSELKKNRFSGICKVCSVMQHAELIFFAAELTYSIIGKVFLVFSAENISHGQNYGSVI